MGIQENLDKLERKLNKEFAVEVQKADEETLNKMVVTLSKEIENINYTQKEDTKLKALKSQAKDLNGGYRDTRKYKKDRLQYVLLNLKYRENAEFQVS